MRKRLLHILIIYFLFISCNLNKDLGSSKNNTIVLKGLIIATNFNIPVPSKIEIYLNDKKINTAETDLKGVFQINLSESLFEENLLAVISPLSNGSKDTLHHQIEKIIAFRKEKNKSPLNDTIKFKFNKTINYFNWKINCCEAIIIERILDSH